MIKINVLSLFNGISCGRVALDRTNISVDRYVSYEIDEYANQIAKKHYPNDEYCGDVKGVDFSQYNGFDMVIGGFPCTDLSIAKKNRQGLKGEHSGLFWVLVKAIKETNCKYFLVENNASMPKADQEIITQVLKVDPIMINSALVSAQQRKRLYWTNIPNIVLPKDKNIILQDIIESGIVDREKSYCLDASYYKGGNIRSYIEKSRRQQIFEPIRIGNIETTAKDKNSQAYRVYSIYGKAVTICGNAGGMGAKTGLYKIDLPDGDYIIRKLTPIECERLQTLQDNYTFGISDTQRYKCIGNGWTVDVISHILSFLPNEYKK